MHCIITLKRFFRGWSEETGTSERESSQNRGWKGDLIPPCTPSGPHRSSKKFSRRLSGVMELNSESECAESWEHANHLNLRVGHERSVIDFNCTRTFEHDIRMRTAEFSPDLRVLCEKIFASPHAGASRTRYPLWFANSIARLSPIAIVPQVSNSVNRLSTQSQSRMQTHQSKKIFRTRTRKFEQSVR
jgi:hypothetical protein